MFMERVLSICKCELPEESSGPKHVFFSDDFFEDAFFVRYEEVRQANSDDVEKIQGDMTSIEFMYLDRDEIITFSDTLSEEGSMRVILPDGILPIDDESSQPQTDSVTAHLRDPEIDYDSQVIFEGFIWGWESIGIPVLFSWSYIAEECYNLPTSYGECMIFYFSN